MLSFQSAVDATITAVAVADGLLHRLPPNGSELVLYDVNRVAEAEQLIRPDLEALIRSLRERSELPFSLTLITNAGPGTEAMVERRDEAGSRHWRDTPIALRWPRGVYSLSHVAVPFPPSDPLYGPGDPNDGRLTLGNLELRGERGLLVVPVEQLMRSTWNPFFDYQARRIAETID